MSEFIDVLSEAELPAGKACQVKIRDRCIALFHTERGYFAADNLCPHRGGPLSDGDLVGNEVTCPWHFWTFDVETGRHADPRLSLVTHKVSVDDGRVRVQLAEEPERFGSGM